MTEPAIKVIFSVFGENLNHLDFTSIVNFSPTSIWSKGDAIQNLPGRERKETAWNYSTEFIRTYHSDEVTKVVSDLIEPKLSEVIEYTQSKQLRSKFDIVVEMAPGVVPSLYFSPEFLKLVSNLSADIDIDMYVFS